MSDDDAQRSANHVAASAEGLRQLIDDVARANHGVWTVAGATVHIGGSDLSVLSRLVGAQCMTRAELAGASGLASSSATELADRLEAAGLLKRSRSTQDRRVVLLRPTAKGRKTVARALAPLDAKLANLTSARNAKQLEQSVKFLLDVNDALLATKRRFPARS